MPRSSITSIECPVRYNGLSQSEIESALIPLLENNACKIEPQITETDELIRVEFRITFRKDPTRIFSEFKKHLHDGGFLTIKEKPPMSDEEKAVRDAVEVLRSHYHK